MSVAGGNYDLGINRSVPHSLTVDGMRFAFLLCSEQLRTTYFRPGDRCQSLIWRSVGRDRWPRLVEHERLEPLTPFGVPAVMIPRPFCFQAGPASVCLDKILLASISHQW